MSVWPDIAWQFSRLTRDGFPAEFAFSGRDAALRLTIEPGGPELPEDEKLDAALRLLDAIRHRRPAPTLIALWRDIQRQAALRWGAWLGLRQSTKSVRTKLYVEVPRGARYQAASAAPLGGRLRMIGYEPDTERSEFYYVLPEKDAPRLSRTLEEHGIDEPGALLDAMAALAGLPVATALQWLGVGLSVATRVGRRHAGIAIYFRAAAVRGGQGRIRDALLRQQDAQGLRDTPYRALFASTDAFALPDHGVVTIGVQPDGGMELRAGISGNALLNRWNVQRDS